MFYKNCTKYMITFMAAIMLLNFSADVQAIFMGAPGRGLKQICLYNNLSYPAIMSIKEVHANNHYLVYKLTLKPGETTWVKLPETDNYHARFYVELNRLADSLITRDQRFDWDARAVMDVASFVNPDAYRPAPKHESYYSPLPYSPAL